MAAFRFRQRRTRRWWYAGATLVAAAFFTVFFVVGAGAVVVGSPSGFESGDGNMVLNVTDGSQTDWNCFVGTDHFQSGTPNSNCNVQTGATQTWADGGTTSVGTNEYEFKGGTKFDTECPVIQTGNNPPKDEWSNIAEYTEVGTSFDLWFYGASIRPKVNGNSSGNVYFNQGTNPKGPGCHTVGDILLAFNFLNGGGNPQMFSLTWIDSGTCYQKQDAPPCWGNEQEINATYFEGNVNAGQIQSADNGISGTLLQPNAFAEFGIDLTAAIKAGNPDATLPCFASQTWVSRSSGSSFTSQPEDVETVSRQTCGTLTIIKHTLDGTGTRSGVDQSFSYTTTGPLTPSAPTLNDSNGATSDVTCTYNSSGVATNAPCNKVVYTSLLPGSYTVTEDSQANTGFSFVSLNCSASGTGTSVTPSSTSTSTQMASITMGLSGSVVCTYTNQQNTATLTTQVSPSTGTIFPGTSVTDTATVTGSTSTYPDSTVPVKFFLCGPEPGITSCASGGMAVTPDGTLSDTTTAGESTATSAEVNTAASTIGLLTPGDYCWGATWAGDSNYHGSLSDDGTNECFTVTQIGTTVTTTPQGVTSGKTTFGSSVTDHAYVKADQSGGGTPTGTVTFFICDPTQVVSGACPDGHGTQVGSPVDTTVTSPAEDPPASYADSSPKTVDKTGTWCWRGVYKPGGTNGNNYTGNEDASPGECFTVTDTTTASSQQVWYPNDSASVHASLGDTIYGTLTIQLYDDSNCGGSTHSATDQVSGQNYSTTVDSSHAAASISVSSGTQTSFGVDTASQGDYSWWVTFVSGDPNVGDSNRCETSNLTINN